MGNSRILPLETEDEKGNSKILPLQFDIQHIIPVTKETLRFDKIEDSKITHESNCLMVFGKFPYRKEEDLKFEIACKIIFVVDKNSKIDDIEPKNLYEIRPNNQKLINILEKTNTLKNINTISKESYEREFFKSVYGSSINDNYLSHF